METSCIMSSPSWEQGLRVGTWSACDICQLLSKIWLFLKPDHSEVFTVCSILGSLATQLKAGTGSKWGRIKMGKQEQGWKPFSLKFSGSVRVLLAIQGIWQEKLSMEPNAELWVGRKFLLGNWAFCLFWRRQLTQSWFCIKSLYPIDPESCLMLYQSVLCEEVFLNEPKIDLCRTLCRVREDGEVGS